MLLSGTEGFGGAKWTGLARNMGLRVRAVGKRAAGLMVNKSEVGCWAFGHK